MINGEDSDFAYDLINTLLIGWTTGEDSVFAVGCRHVQVASVPESRLAFIRTKWLVGGRDCSQTAAGKTATAFDCS